MKSKNKSKIIIIILIVVALIGLVIGITPMATMFIKDYESSKAIIEYENNVDQMSNKQIHKEKSKAKEYNKRRTKIVTKEEKEDKAHNSFAEGELEAYISIPKIDVYQPIFEGTKEEVLTKGVGHLKQTSFPAGGKSTHSVLVGHTNFKNTVIFDKIDKLKNGDVFYIKFLKDTIEYKVDRRIICLPEEVWKYIGEKKNKDLCTLYTCTPRNVNSHRLLIRGHRIPYDGKDIKEKTIKQTVEKQKSEKDNIILLIIITAGVTLITIITVSIILKKRRRKVANRNDTEKE